MFDTALAGNPGAYGGPFRPVLRPDQDLCLSIVGRTELKVFESMYVSHGYGDYDDCYTVGRSRAMFIDQQARASVYDFEEWAVEEMYAEAFDWSDYAPRRVDEYVTPPVNDAAYGLREVAWPFPSEE